MAVKRLVRFLCNVDGYEKGQEVEFSAGIADALVRWRRVAVYAGAQGVETRDVPGPRDVRRLARVPGVESLDRMKQPQLFAIARRLGLSGYVGRSNAEVAQMIRDAGYAL